MKIQAGYEISYNCSQATPMILMLSVHPSRAPDLITPDRLRLDPEIPVNIVDLGLIYGLAIVPAENGKRIELRMTLTAPGCSMSDVIKREIEYKLARLPEVSQVQVEIVFDPPWTAAKMSDAAKLAVGLDLDFGALPAAKSAFKILR